MVPQVSSRTNRFDDFFRDQSYIILKNHLYNYTLRKSAVSGSLTIGSGATLEIGSGMSPVLISKGRAVYCDVSFAALQILRSTLNSGSYVVADCTELPFKEGSFANAVCSEVLEHVEGDRKAVGEIARILTSHGCLVLTFPHRQAYFSHDDRFVHHLRRYELDEMKTILKDSGFTIIKVGKVLGLVEKAVMIPATFIARAFQPAKPAQKNARAGITSSRFFISFFALLNRFLALLARLDAAITPLRYATVLMIKAEKR